MNTESKLYSPWPPEHYTRPDTDNAPYTVGVGREFLEPGRRPAWNLYWLSDPAVDHFLLADTEWASAEPIDMKLLAACFQATRQVVRGSPLHELLTTLTPMDFARFLRIAPKAEVEALEPFKLRGAAWLMTLTERAAGARGVLVTEGNVTTGNFTRKPSLVADETAAPTSAKIMPLALRMKMT